MNMNVRKDVKLAKTIDHLHLKYERNCEATSYTEAGTKHGRLGLMAGHKM